MKYDNPKLAFSRMTEFGEFLASYGVFIQSVIQSFILTHWEKLDERYFELELELRMKLKHTCHVCLIII